MKKPTILTLSALSLLTPLALAQNQAAPQLPASWTNANLSTATYVVLDGQIEGNANVISAEQQKGVLEALKRDSAGAIKRHYPGATIATDPNTPNAIKVTPVLSAPSALVPWAKMDAKLKLQLADGNQVALVNTFSVFELYQHRAEATNYAYDQVVLKLP